MLDVVIFQSVFCYFMLYLMRCHHDLLGLYSCVFKNLLEFLLSLPLEWGKNVSLQLQGVEHFEPIPDLFLFPFSVLLIAAMLISRTFQVFLKKHSVKCNRS